VVRHVLDLDLGLALLGDVLMGGDPAAAGIGRCRILNVRPFCSSTMLSFASLETATLVRHADIRPGHGRKAAASKRRSTISVSFMPG
jgi:hypothetical protein